MWLACVSFQFLFASVTGEPPVAPAPEQDRPAPTLSFAAELEGKMEAIASDPDSLQPTIVASE